MKKTISLLACLLSLSACDELMHLTDPTSNEPTQQEIAMGMRESLVVEQPL